MPKGLFKSEVNRKPVVAEKRVVQAETVCRSDIKTNTECASQKGGSSQGKHSAYPDMPGNSETWWKEDKPQNAVLPGFQIHKNSRLGHNGGRMSWCDV